MRSLTHLSAFVSDQGSEGLGVEAAVAEAQAPVHAVSCQLQGLLTDVVLMENQIYDLGTFWNWLELHPHQNLHAGMCTCR